MKNKKIIIIVAVVVIAAFVLGTLGVVKVLNPNGTSAEEKGTLVGGLITYDIDDAIEGKIYAEKVVSEDGENWEYVFPGLDAPFIALVATARDGLNSACWETKTSDDEYLHYSVHVGANEESVDFYFYPVLNDGPEFFYLHPIYQTSDGSVYVTNGDCLKINYLYGSSNSMGRSEKTTVTDNGETEEWSSSVTLHFDVIDVPVGWAVSEYDENGQLISSTEYDVSSLPEEITVSEKAEYIVTENIFLDKDGNRYSEREIVNRGNDSADTFAENDLGLGVLHSIELNWQ